MKNDKNKDMKLAKLWFYSKSKEEQKAIKTNSHLNPIAGAKAGATFDDYDGYDNIQNQMIHIMYQNNNLIIGELESIRDKLKSAYDKSFDNDKSAFSTSPVVFSESIDVWTMYNTLNSVLRLVKNI